MKKQIITAILAIASTSTIMAQEHQHKKHHIYGDGKPANSANEYMHKSSTDDLINRFESKERDEYQQPHKVMQYLGDINGKAIMDIGAATGYFSVKLAKHGANVIAADVNDEFQTRSEEHTVPEIGRAHV